MEPVHVYLPIDRRLALARGQDLADRASGSVLFADISGSTPLAEALANELGNPRGAEELTSHLNRVYGALIDVLQRWGGSVTGFSGDAVTSWFEGDEGWRALASGLEIQKAIGAMGAVITPGGTPVTLAVKVAVAAGPVRRFLVGDPAIQLIDVLAGRTLDELAAAEHLAERGEVVAPERMISRLGPGVEVAGWRTAGEPARRVALVGGLSRTVPPVPWPDLPAEALSTEQIRPWLLAPIRERLEKSAGQFLADLRPAVALFIAFQGIDYDEDEQAGCRLDEYIRHVQGVVNLYEGILLQVTMGDKGSYLYVSFGAPVAHDDDAERAVAAALDLQSLPSSLDFIQDVRMGLAQGQMYAGAYGGANRRTYGVQGDKANLAARLMQIAHPGEVLCDEAVYRLAQGRWAFEALPPVRVKGKAGLIRLYRPTGEAAGAVSGEEVELVGRLDEVARLESALDDLQEGSGRLLSIEGEAGIGKSRMVAEMVRRMRRRGIAGLLGAGQSIEQQNPYRAWKDIFGSYFELENAGSVEERQERVRNVVEELVPDMLPRLPLLNALLNLSLPETPLTAALEPAVRQESLASFLITLLGAWARERPMVLVLEDAHWLDSLSWDLVEKTGRALLTAGSPFLLVIVHRPLEELSPGLGTLERLRSLPGSERLSLAGLSPGEVIDLVRLRLGLPPGSLPAAVAALVRERAGGNPFFAEELVYNLLERGMIRMETHDGAIECQVSPELAQVGAILPDTLQGLILARIDRLPPDRQFTLKVAAVIGRTFAYSPLYATLARLDPVVAAELQTNLKELAQREFTVYEAPEPDLIYIFKHIITQEAAYQTLLFAQRKEIHRIVAEWFEQTYGLITDGQRRAVEESAPEGSILPLLVYHYHQAEDAGSERYYARLAGRQAAAQYANTEALTYLSRALELTPPDDRTGRFELVMAREKVYSLIGERGAQQQDLDSLDRLAEDLDDDEIRVQILIRLARYTLDTSSYLASASASELAASLARKAALVPLEAEAEAGFGRALWKQADYAGARARLQRALALSREAGLLSIEAECLLNLGIVADLSGDRSLARDYFLQNLEIQRKRGDRYMEGTGYNNLGVIAWRMGDLAEAEKHFEQSLRMDRELGARSSEMIPLGNLAIIANKRLDFPRARSFGEQALALARETGDRYAQSRTLGILSNVYLNLGLFLDALAASQEALRLDRETGDRQDEAHRLESLGYLSLRLGDLESARRYYEQAWLLGREIGDRDVELFYHRGLAMLYRYLGEHPSAVQSAQEAARIMEELGESGEEIESWTVLGLARLGLGDLEGAQAAFQRAIHLAQEAPEGEEAVEARAGLARLALAQGNISTALEISELLLPLLGEAAVDGADEPFQVWLTCYRVLHASEDWRAPEILETAITRLKEQAGGLEGEMRTRFLENLPAHRELIATWEEVRVE